MIKVGDVVDYPRGIDGGDGPDGGGKDYPTGNVEGCWWVRVMVVGEGRYSVAGEGAGRAVGREPGGGARSPTNLASPATTAPPHGTLLKLQIGDIEKNFLKSLVTINK